MKHEFESFQEEFGCTMSFVYKSLHRVFEAGMKKATKLSQSEIMVIMEIRKAEKISGKTELKQIEIANILGVRPISLSRLIEKMEKKGIVKRFTPENDKRVKFVSLDYNSTLVKNAIEFMQNNGRNLIDKALDGFLEEERVEFLRMIKKMKECVINNIL